VCFAIIDVQYTVDKQPVVPKRVETKEQLTKEIEQLERLGTVAKVTVYLNHHTHRLVSSWSDELYREPTQEVTP
jgi:hypothetical protein